MKTKAAVLREWKGKISIEELELDPPKAGEVMVKVAHCGWCHSDQSFWEGTMGLDILPFVMGHECAGIVEEVGPRVDHLKPGDHVVACFVAPCGVCEQCVSGRTYTCENLMTGIAGGKLLDGTTRFKTADREEINHILYVSGFSEYITAPAISSVKIRDDLPLDQAALLGCCVGTGWGAAVRTAEVQNGESVAVWGCGGIGLNIIQGARLRQAYPIIAVDMEGSKEKIAREMGATHFINNSKNDPVPIIREELTNSKGVQHVFEAVGDPGAYLQAFYTLGIAGTLYAVGLVKLEEMVSLPFMGIPFLTQRIQGVTYGSVRWVVDVPRMADLAVKGDLKLDKLITEHFKLEDLDEVIKTMEKHQIIGRWVCDL